MSEEAIENVFLYGMVGSGKTSIFNLLTGGNFATTNSGNACTRIVQNEKCKFKPFSLLDFPGTNAAVDVTKHIQSLRENPFRVICIVHKMSSRHDEILNRLNNLFQFFSYHIPNVVVILTHCDEYKDTQLDEAKFIIETKFKINNVFHKDLRTTGERLANWLFSFIQPNEQQIKLGIKPFIKVNKGEGVFETDNLAKLASDTIIDQKVLKSRTDLEKEFKSIYDGHMEQFKTTNADPELKRALYFSLKNCMDSFTDRHAKFVAPLFTDIWELNAELMIFTNILLNIYSPLKKIITQDIKVETVIYNGQGSSYRKCPKCGLIWLRIYGCDSITCGKRSISRDFNNNTWNNYTIEWTNNKVNVKKQATSPTQTSFSDTEVTGLTDVEKKKNEQLVASKKTLISPAGCGATMKFSEMIDVTKEVEEQLREFDFSHHSEVQNIVNKHAQLVSTDKKSVSSSSSSSTSTSATSSSSSTTTTTSSSTTTQDDVKKWSKDEVKNWIKSLELSAYEKQFENINGSTLLGLTEDGIEKMGITSLDHRKKLIKGINDFLTAKKI